MEIYDRFNMPIDLRTRVQRLEAGETRLRHGSELYPIGQFRRPSSSSLVGGQIGATGVRKRGSIVLRILQGLFTYTATQNSIHWFWDGTNSSERLILLLVDNTQKVIPAGNIVISGLSSSTVYKFMPFWSIHENNCSLGWVIGDNGKPQIAHTSVSAQSERLWHLESREPLADSPISATTLAGGDSSTSPPSGSSNEPGGHFGGGGGGHAFR